MAARGVVAKCDTCGMRASRLTTDCLGEPPHRLWVQMFDEDLCDYIGDKWLDWMGRPVDSPKELRDRSRKYLQDKAALYDTSTRLEELQEKMDMEDALLGNSRFNHWNFDPWDLFR